MDFAATIIRSRQFLLLITVIGVWPLLALPQASSAHQPGRLPNIVIVVADDLGMECVGAYGGLSYRTPHLDAMAADGLRFTHCFANPLCSPSRAQLLTGRYPFRNGITRVIYEPEQHREFLDPAKETSFANLLKAKGYATAIAGKWQVSFLHERDTVRDFGFDEYQMWQIFYNGEKTSRYANPTMRQNGKVLHEELHGRYGPDVNLEFLIDFMKRHRDGQFLVYYTALMPHYPWEPTPDSDAPLKPAIGIGDPKYLPDMVAYLDKQVGQLRAALDELGVAENTLFLFTGDNGTDQRIKSQWTDGKVTRTVAGGKGTMTDAGTRVPLIAHWPGVVERGKVNHDLIDLSDFLPTVVEVAGSGSPEKIIDGHSFAPQLRGERGQPREWIHVQNQGQRHVRNREYILTNQGKLRPVVATGMPEAKPLTGELNPEQQAAFELLQPAIERSQQAE